METLAFSQKASYTIFRQKNYWEGSSPMRKGIVILLIAILVAVCAVAGGLLYKNYIAISGLTAELEEAQAALAQTKTELDDTNSRLAETLAALEAAQAALAESQIELDDTNNRLEETLVALEQAQTRIAELEKQMEELKAQPAPEVRAPEVSQPVVSQPVTELPVASQPAQSQPSGAGTSTELNPPLDSLPTGPRAPLTPGGLSVGQNGTGSGDGKLPEGPGGWDSIG
jgi:uncharacterized phage infection (PIP) family protein YhgE